jgi:hypothetical protein
LANRARIGVIGDEVPLEAGIPLFSLDPRKTAVLKNRIFFISLDFSSSEKRFAFQ